MNSVVQGILHTKPLVDWFLSHADQRTGKTRNEIKIANRNKLSSAWDSHRKWNGGKTDFSLLRAHEGVRYF